MYVNSRNFTLALKTDRPSRLRVQDLDPATGQIMEKELPEYLQNFEIQSPLKGKTQSYRTNSSICASFQSAS